MWDMLGINSTWGPEYSENPEIWKSKGTVNLFDQSEFFAGYTPTSMDDNGIVYIPNFC